jgi:hypothetical protein
MPGQVFGPWRRDDVGELVLLAFELVAVPSARDAQIAAEIAAFGVAEATAGDADVVAVGLGWDFSRVVELPLPPDFLSLGNGG